MKDVSYLLLLVGVGFVVGFTEAQAPPLQPREEKAVLLKFGECVGKFSVFLLENHLDRPIYARVQRVDYWKEYKKGNMELGVHFVERVPPVPKPNVPTLGPWDAPPSFREISPGSQVRYAVQVPQDKAEYRVRVPYMENGDVARRLDNDFPNIVKNEMPLVEASWKEVFSAESVGRCQ